MLVSPKKLQDKLYELSHKSSPAFQQLLSSSFNYRTTIEQQHSTFYTKRNYWEYGVKLAVATLGLASLAIGEYAPLILFLSSLALIANTIVIEYIADLNQPKFDLSEQSELKIKQSAVSARFWRAGLESHQVHQSNQTIKKNMAKLGLALTLGYGLFMLVTQQLTFSLVFTTLMFISSLFIEASKLPSTYVESNYKEISP